MHACPEETYCALGFVPDSGYRKEHDPDLVLQGRTQLNQSCGGGDCVRSREKEKRTSNTLRVTDTLIHEKVGEMPCGHLKEKGLRLQLVQRSWGRKAPSMVEGQEWLAWLIRAHSGGQCRR